MSKITFRADDDLIEQLEEFDASKSETMREALREYLGEPSDTRPSAGSSDLYASESGDADSIDGLIAERIDAIVADRLNEAFTPSQPQDINVNIALDGENAAVNDRQESVPDNTPTEASNTDTARKTGAGTSENTPENADQSCSQCGETVSPGHVYCPNCGEKASHRVFCDCGDELRSDWGFCPSCGRRTPAADVLDRS